MSEGRKNECVEVNSYKLAGLKLFKTISFSTMSLSLYRNPVFTIL